MVISSPCLIEDNKERIVQSKRFWEFVLLSVVEKLILLVLEVAKASTDDNGDVQITATIDGHLKIFEQLALMGYHTDSDKLTFQKGAFSPQWRHSDDSSKTGRKISDAEFKRKQALETELLFKRPQNEVIKESRKAMRRKCWKVIMWCNKRRSEENRTRQDKGKAIMIESEPKKKSKKELE
ncbi:hypothetical protein Tco_1133346 [Tanacetum coccineum]